MSHVATAKPFALTGWHVLAGFVLFFAIVIGLDVSFATLAYRSFPGQSANDPYEAGIEYNRTLAQRRTEAALGWRAEVSKAATGLALEVQDRTGRPLRGLTVTGQATRPATEAGQQTLSFRETVPGTYVAAPPAGAGGWDVSITARDRQGRLFEAQRRLQW